MLEACAYHRLVLRGRDICRAPGLLDGLSSLGAQHPSFGAIVAPVHTGCNTPIDADQISVGIHWGNIGHEGGHAASLGDLFGGSTLNNVAINPLPLPPESGFAHSGALHQEVELNPQPLPPVFEHGPFHLETPFMHDFGHH